ncbi:RraA-like protein [Sodiomyces alkalinus F11]|uniref:RraA-like protein n=1 Tax=Sodiomyces alkalinus (strain CBS 110278 / VKM F-3762 / F11) TaxID=1314773 RepID=A0A3N2Q600_SODAK|nr:RraA-like protein [Sodiomyces alkalinus F11]ROT42201.1 RraA-like protein [Sodiomyces alkalinus F11]
MASSVTKRLARFTSCDIADALVELQYPYGGFLDGIRMWSPTFCAGPRKMVGPAVTVKMVAASDTSAPKPARHFADYNEVGKVMYVQQPKALYSACWGGLMSTRAAFLGAQGVVVDGRVRDLKEHREKDIPVFARDTSILGSNTFSRASEINVPLQFKGDLWIHPADYLVGDVDGVAVVPRSLIERVITMCEERAEVDHKVFKGLHEGMTMEEAVARFRN